MALPKFEDFKAPWELDKDGKAIPIEDQKPDAAVLKKHYYNVLSDKEKAQLARDTALGTVTELTGKVAEYQTAAEKKSTEGLSEIEKLTASVKALSERAEKAEFETSKLKIITDNKIRPDAADLLSGTTEAELKASAARLVALGLVETASTDGETNSGQVDEQGNPLETKPRQRHNSGDPKPDDTTGDLSVADFVKQQEAGQLRL